LKKFLPFFFMILEVEDTAFPHYQHTKEVAQKFLNFQAKQLSHPLGKSMFCFQKGLFDIYQEAQPRAQKAFRWALAFSIFQKAKFLRLHRARNFKLYSGNFTLAKLAYNSLCCCFRSSANGHLQGWYSSQLRLAFLFFFRKVRFCSKLRSEYTRYTPYSDY
jgi:hypothetical protein